MSGTETKCPACGRPLERGSGPGLITKAVNCPICKLPAYTASLDGHELLHCAECQGAAIKRDVMMKLQPHGPKELVIGADEKGYRRPPFFEPRKKPPFLICPFCGKRMKESKLGKLNVDICEKCDALWLDGPKWPQLTEILGPYKWKHSKRD